MNYELIELFITDFLMFDFWEARVVEGMYAEPRLLLPDCMRWCLWLICVVYGLLILLSRTGPLALFWFACCIWSMVLALGLPTEA